MIDRRIRSRACQLLLTYSFMGPCYAESADRGDPSSLAGLHDIVAPAPVALWWPLAPGWYLLVAVIALLTGWGLWRLWRRRRARRYRVEALAELHALRRRSVEPREAASLVLVLLKRTALAAYPRSQVASLNGAPWWRFLDLSGGSDRFSNGLGELAERLAYAQQGADESDLEQLYRAAERWISRHSPSERRSVSAAVTDATTGIGV